MTTTHIYADGTVQPELPPLPVGALAAGVADLLQQAGDLPQPHYITVSVTQNASFQFTSEQASERAITRWAARFGCEVTSQPGKCQGEPGTWYRAKFDYYGIAVTAYAHIPAAPADT